MLNQNYNQNFPSDCYHYAWFKPANRLPSEAGKE